MVVLDEVESIGVTSDHLMYVNDKWTPAAEMQIGDSLRGIEGQTVRITQKVWINWEVETYNLHTSHDTHNYFTNGVLAHNLKMARGAVDFVVPGGYENDTFPIMLSSGERVNVDQPRTYRNEGKNSGGDTYNTTVNVNVDKLSSDLDIRKLAYQIADEIRARRN